MEEKRRSIRVKNALCFVPIFCIIIYFIDKEKTDRVLKNIVYSVSMMIFFILLSILPFLSIVTSILLYLFVSLFFGYKSYIGEDIEITFIDGFLKKDQ